MDSLDAEDIIDEVLNLFRANVLFRNFDIRGPADRTLIYLTLHVVQCLVKCEKIEDKTTGRQKIFFFSMFVVIFPLRYHLIALRELKALSTKQFACPGDSSWPLGGLFPSPLPENVKQETGEKSFCFYILISSKKRFFQIYSKHTSSKQEKN